jgi:DnaJ-class molecular chaperone
LPSERDPYTVLQVQSTADADVIRAAYRALARRFHPDGEQPDVRRMTEINRAWEHLKTPEARAAYDAGARQGPPIAAGGPSTLYQRWQASTSNQAEGLAATVLDFGTYEGWQVADVARKDPAYLRWLSRHSSGIRYREAIAAVLPGVETGRKTRTR